MTSPRRAARGTVKLHLDRHVGVEVQGKTLKLRRKGLALLVYLALEGPKSRDHLADLLWGRASAVNLRVELHRLKRAFRGVTDLFADGEDPLSLPECFEIDCPSSLSNQTELLQGLDDLSPVFQDWLELQRIHLSTSSARPPLREALIQELAVALEPPHLLILRGQPGSGRRRFAQDLAAALRLPFVAGALGPHGALRYIPAAQCDAKVRDYLLQDRQSLWVIEQSAFGEEADLLLDLRGTYPPGQTRFLDLPHLSWHETLRFVKLPFHETAKVYTATGGHPAYLSELLAVRPEGGFQGPLPLPQRIRALFQSETRALTKQARYALERLSVHPGLLNDELLRAFEADGHLAELERHGWLCYEQGWQFADDMVRRVLYGALPEGQKQRYHKAAARALERADDDAACYHRQHLSCERSKGVQTLERSSDDLTLSAQDAADAPTPFAPPNAGYLKEQALLELKRFGQGVEGEAGRLALLRRCAQQEASGVELELPDGPCLVRVKGKVYTEAATSVRRTGAAPLCLSFLGKQPRDVVLSCASRLGAEGVGMRLPLSQQFDYWFHVTEHRQLRVKGDAFTGVVALELSAYAVPSTDPARLPGARNLFAISAPPGKAPNRSYAPSRQAHLASPS